jgi:pimeloyl-ACP methyl ester carboxylesterase
MPWDCSPPAVISSTKAQDVGIEKSPIAFYQIVTAIAHLVARPFQSGLDESDGLTEQFRDANLKRYSWSAPMKGTSKVAFLVHGYDSVPSDLQPTASFLQASDYRVFRFVHNSKDELASISNSLARGVCEIAQRTGGEEIMVLGHSMGGLIARRAVASFARIPELRTVPIRLVTIASPFGGVFSATGSNMMPLPGLGVRESHRDLSLFSKFIVEPGKLPGQVRHLKIETDEPASFDETKDGAGGRSDVVFTLANQRSSAVDGDSALDCKLVWKAGHVASINVANRLPESMAHILGLIIRGEIPCRSGN